MGWARSPLAVIQQLFDLVEGLIKGVDRLGHRRIRGVAAGPLAGHLGLEVAQATIDALQPGGEGQKTGLPFIEAATGRVEVASQLVHQTLPLQPQGS